MQKIFKQKQYREYAALTCSTQIEFAKKYEMPSFRINETCRKANQRVDEINKI